MLTEGLALRTSDYQGRDWNLVRSDEASRRHEDQRPPSKGIH
jgi:hypothetical protein